MEKGGRNMASAVCLQLLFDIALKIGDTRLAGRTFPGDTRVTGAKSDKAALTLVNDDTEFFGF
jgi:hypothetical protein